MSYAPVHDHEDDDGAPDLLLGGEYADDQMNREQQNRELSRKLLLCYELSILSEIAGVFLLLVLSASESCVLPLRMWLMAYTSQRMMLFTAYVKGFSVHAMAMSEGYARLSKTSKQMTSIWVFVGWFWTDDSLPSGPDDSPLLYYGVRCISLFHIFYFCIPFCIVCGCVLPLCIPAACGGNYIRRGCLQLQLAMQVFLATNGLSGTLQRGAVGNPLATVMGDARGNAGASQEEIISALPSVPYKEGMFPDANHSTCVICLIEYEGGDALRVLPCDPEHRHHFHVACIDQWLTLNRTCPTCRATVIEATPGDALV